jgi:hypothetical protein
MPGPNPGLLRLWNWIDDLTTRLDLIHLGYGSHPQSLISTCVYPYCTGVYIHYLSLMSESLYSTECSLRQLKDFIRTGTKIHVCIPFLGIRRPQSQFPHSCVFERFIPYIPRIGPYISCSRIGRSIVGTYKSPVDT